MKKLSLLLAILVVLLVGCGAAAEAEITAEQAQTIALEHAGLTADQVTRLNTHQDRDSGNLHYDVEFHHDGFEYDYEIDAATGTILSQEKDRND